MNVQIAQVDGPLSIELKGAALPHQGLEIGSELRRVRTLYPGQRRASTQVMGVDPQPITLTGRLHDRLLDGAGSALALVQELRELFHRRSRVEVTFDAVQVRGLITALRYTIQGPGSYEYTAEIEVDEDLTDTSEATAAAPTASDVRDDAGSGLTATDDALLAIPFSE